MRQSAPARSWRPRHSCYFTRRPPGPRGRATNRLLPPAEGLDRKPAIALTVINLGLLSSDAHGNSFTAGAGKSLSPAAFDAPSRQRSVRRVCESVRELLLAGQQGLFLSRRFHATARAVAVFPESYIEAGYEEYCFRTPNSGRSYARRAHASRACPRSWMSPSVGSILGEQGQQPADQCRLYARLHRTGA